MNKDIYRLVKPYQSNKVHEASTFMHGANKCYKELKKNNVQCEMFTIMNINDNSLYDFNMNNKPKMLLEEKNDPTQLLNINISSSCRLGVPYPFIQFNILRGKIILNPRKFPLKIPQKNSWRNLIKKSPKKSFV